jgi:hypothetical protein
MFVKPAILRDKEKEKKEGEREAYINFPSAQGAY